MPSEDTYPFKNISFECHDGTKCSIGEEACKKLSPYQAVVGHKPLIEWVRKIHKAYHSPHHFENDQSGQRFDVAITEGAAAALAYVFGVLVEKDDLVLLEDYGFGATRMKVKMRYADCVAMETDEFGIIPEKLNNQLQNLAKENRLPRVLVTNPNGQNPTGSVCPMDRKKIIYKIAQEYDLMIVEDDPYYYLQYSEKRTMSYQSIDVDGRVVRIDSVSKLLAPSLRVGWVSGPHAIVSRVVYFHMTCTMGGSILSQLAVEKMFDSWKLEGFEKRIKFLSEKYRILRNITLNSLEKWFKDLGEWSIPSAGIYVWIKVKNCENADFLGNIEKAKEWKVFVAPGMDYTCAYSGGTPFFRICFTRINEEYIDKGIQRIADFVKSETK